MDRRLRSHQTREIQTTGMSNHVLNIDSSHPARNRLRHLPLLKVIVIWESWVKAGTCHIGQEMGDVMQSRNVIPMNQLLLAAAE
jgi:hypothetical protein